jgi:hypothetical protein
MLPCGGSIRGKGGEVAKQRRRAGEGAFIAQKAAPGSPDAACDFSDGMADSIRRHGYFFLALAIFFAAFLAAD